MIRDSWGALVGLVVTVVLVGAVGGCYPNPDDLRRSGSTTGTAGRTGSAGTGGTGGSTSAGTAGTTGKAGSSGSGTAGTGGSGPGVAGSTGGPGTAGSSGPGSAGGSGTGTGGTSGAGILETTFTKWATAICARDQACYPTYYVYQWGDTATCIARNKLWIKAYLAAYADVTATDASLGGCATQVSAQSCLDYANGKSLAMCTLPGKRTTGQRCDTGDQCTTLRCANNTTMCGTCSAKLALGGACVADAECTEPLVCGSAGTCVAAKASGASCAADTQSCARSLRCRGGICSAPITTAGTACVGEDDCDIGRGVLCDTVSSFKCVAWTSSATTCTSTATLLTFCSKAGICDTDTSTCLAAAAEGKACDEDLGPACLYPAVCSVSTSLCTIPTAAGSCTATGATTSALTLEEAVPGTKPDVLSVPVRPLERGAFPLRLDARELIRAGLGWSGAP